MNPNITKIIDQYLSGELNAEDTKIVEQRIAENPEFRTEVLLQQQISEASARAYLRSNVQSAKKSYHLQKLLKWGGSIIGASVIVAGGMFYASSIYADQSKTTQANQIAISDAAIVELNKSAEFENIPTQLFEIGPEGDYVLSKDGVLLSVPSNAFMLKGNSYTGPVIISYQEAMDPDDIMMAGLSTTTGDTLLETQGMFSIKGFTPDGKLLDINPEVGLYMQVPVKENKEGMKLYESKRENDGSLDWINPRELEKIPVPVDMSELDFYPKGFEDQLDQVKWKQGKKERDSLYLSFENGRLENGYIPQEENDNSHEITFPARRITPEEREYLYGDNRPINLNMTSDEAKILRSWVENPNYAEFHNFLISNNIFLADTTSQNSGIQPSSVFAFWNNQFNNTNLATHDFEKRMKEVFKTCDPQVLKKYTSQLDKGLSQIDAEISKMGYPAFDEFAKERLGKVEMDNPHLENLKKFYSQTISELKKKSNADQLKDFERKLAWDKEVNDSRNKAFNRNSIQRAKVLMEEYKFNHPYSGNLLSRSVGFHVYRPGPVNIDQQIWQATVNRETTTIVDQRNGKVIQINYTPFQFELSNPEKYIKLYAYLLPDNLNSFNRINPTNGRFDFPLNSRIKYDLAVIGVTEKGFEYLDAKNVQNGIHKTLQLKELDESSLKKQLGKLRAFHKGKDATLLEDLTWLKKEGDDYKEQKMRCEMLLFRQKLYPLVYPCGVHYGVEYDSFSDRNQH